MKTILKLIAYCFLIGLLGWSIKNFIRVYNEYTTKAYQRFDLIEEQLIQTNQTSSSTFNRTLSTNISDYPRTNHEPDIVIKHKANDVNTNYHDAKPAQPNISDSGSMRKQSSYGLGFYGFIGVLALLTLALLIGHDVSNIITSKFQDFIYDESKLSQVDQTYEKAEQLWARGDYLGAIELLRAYLKKYPRHIYAKFRIAEIYEQNLNNLVAAALEYEEILQYKIDPEKWGWAAIHLCNLYNRIGQSQKAIELLQRIVQEYGQTEAAEKARKRLELIKGETQSHPSLPPQDTTHGSSNLWLPKGFKPKN